MGWLLEQGIISNNAAKAVKELHRQPLAPQGLEPSQVRKLLREAELRKDLRSLGIFNLCLLTGCRISDLIKSELRDIVINERSGHIVFRQGKGNKERQCPLPLSVRRL
jgi:site-specific recombinase XerD